MAAFRPGSAIIGATIVFSSFLSGVFGMAGGMILLGVLLNYFDVATGMILFSIIQLFANGWRALQWRRYVLWPIFGWYVLGARHLLRGHVDDCLRSGQGDGLPALGLMPFAVEALPAAARPNIEWRGVPFLTGVLDHRDPDPGRRRRHVPRHFLPEEHARPQDHQRHQGGDAVVQPRGARALFRLALRDRRSAGGPT